MLDINQIQPFGTYRIEKSTETHAIIHCPANINTTFYELQVMKSIAFGGDSCAIEIFPATKDLVDGENQRHLWAVNYDSIPHL